MTERQLWATFVAASAAAIAAATVYRANGGRDARERFDLARVAADDAYRAWRAAFAQAVRR